MKTVFQAIEIQNATEASPVPLEPAELPKSRINLCLVFLSGKSREQTLKF